MDIQIRVKFINYLFKMLSGQYDNLPIGIQMDTDNRYIPATNGTTLERVTPETVGISTEVVLKLIKNLSSDKSIGLHGIMMARDGKIFAEAYSAPYNNEYRHISHSMCKSVTSMAVGIAIEEGYINLDEHLVDILSDRVGILTSKNIREITVKHLLTMSTGIKFNELSTVFENDWIKGYLESGTSFQPGTGYEYNSLNTYMLSVIIKIKTGEGLLDFIITRILNPLGINDITWERCPMGYEKGGWGMKLNLMDMTKFGMLYLQNGRWLIDDIMKEIVPSKWVELSCSKQIEQNADKLSTGYGYQIWGLEGNAYAFSGMLGQNVIVVPERNIVISMTGGSVSLFPDSKAIKLILNLISDDNNFSEDVLSINPIEQYIYKHSLENMEVMEKLKVVKPNLSNLSEMAFKRAFIDDKLYKRYIKRVKNLSGKKYDFSEPVGSVMPIMIQAMYNNYSKGITDILFSYDNDEFAIEFNETHTRNVIKIGFNHPLYQEYILNGQSFSIGTVGKFTNDEDGNVVLKIKVSFVETSNTKIIKIFFFDDRIKLQLLEAPSMEGILEYLIGDDSPIIKKSIPIFSTSEYMKYRLDKFISPWSYGFEK